MSPENGAQSAREAFRTAWDLYAKYAGGPKGSSMTYWRNLDAESKEAADRLGTPLAEALITAVVAECSRKQP